MKWIYNPNSNELINTDTGSRILYYSEYGHLDYEYIVVFEGPIGGFWQHEERDIRTRSVLFGGTESECLAYLRDLAGQFNAFALPQGNGTSKPEPPYVPADCNDIPF